MIAFLDYPFLWIAAPIFLGVCWLAHELIDGDLGKRIYVAVAILWSQLREAMKENARYAIIGLALIIAVSIYACSGRYYSIGNRIILDRWTGRTFDGDK